MKTNRWRILQQMPELRTQVIDRLVGDTDFQSLCNNYDRCVEVLDNLREQAEQLPDRVAEYEQLLADLEDDIRRSLVSAEIQQ